MAKYRNRLQIIAEILEIVRDGARKTHIMYQANLSYKLLIKYLDVVLECGLVRRDRNERYVVAPKGEKFLKRFASYLQRQERVHEELKAVDAEKVFLESNYVNSQPGAASIKGGSGSKGKRGSE